MSEFRVSSRCQDGGCVGVRVEVAVVAVRDEKNPAAGAFTVTRAAWLELTAALRRGELGGEA